MGKEVEMVDAVAPSTDTKPAEPVEEDKQVTVQAALKANVALLEKAVRLKETRLLMGRLLRQTAGCRKQLTADVLVEFLTQTLPEGLDARKSLISRVSAVSGSMDTDLAVKAPAEGTAAPVGLIPEVQAYAYLLVVTFLMDQAQPAEAKVVAEEAVAFVSTVNRRTLDAIAARLYFYYSWAHESTGTLSEIRSNLLALHRTSVLRHDENGQEMLLNLLLRNYLHYNLYDQAEKFRSKAQRVETARSQQQLCRTLYYVGRIRAIQLEYTDAKDALSQASRKAPTGALGFRVEVTKWLVLVRLLLGEIPEHKELTEPALAVALKPYFDLTQAVRIGDLIHFKRVAEEHAATFQADKTVNLVVRLRHNVIRAGLRNLVLAYSRISLADVAQRLGLPSADDTEGIVAKAIRDGGIDASIDHEGGFMQSKESVDIYSTHEPQAAFHARVAFCLDIHNEAVRAMRFEPGAHKHALESEEARKERLAAEAQLAKEIEEEEEDEGM